MPYTDSITSLANATLVCQRRTSAAFIDGRAQPPVLTPFNAVASVQPGQGRDLQRLPQGHIVGDVQVLFTKTEMRAGAEGTGTLGDLVTYKGKTFEVEHVEDWSSFGAPYWRAIMRATG